MFSRLQRCSTAYNSAFVRLNGVNAKEHPVYRELTRVRQYFDKVKDIEFPAQKTLEFDKTAAARIIKHALVTYSLLLLDGADARNSLVMRMNSLIA